MSSASEESGVKPPGALTEPRELLVNTAVKFLRNPKVESSSPTLKRAFLEKKGLTPDEIELAMRLSTKPAVESIPQSSYQIVAANPSQAFPPYYSVSRWRRLIDSCSAVIIVGSFAWSFYMLWEKILKPYWFGLSKESDRISKVEENLASTQAILNQSVIALQNTLQHIQKTLQQINEKQEEIVTQSANLSRLTVDLELNEIKSEVATLKGLLLNRRQFPPAPVPSAIPQWQFTASLDDDNKISEVNIETPLEEQKEDATS